MKCLTGILRGYMYSSYHEWKHVHGCRRIFTMGVNPNDMSTDGCFLAQVSLIQFAYISALEANRMQNALVISSPVAWRGGLTYTRHQKDMLASALSRAGE